MTDGFCILVPPDKPIFKVGTQLISSNLSVVKGDTVLVICESTSNPAPFYKWTDQSSGIIVLTINSIQSSVTKTCSAHTTMIPTVGSAETPSSSATLNINVMSKFFRDLIEITSTY